MSRYAPFALALLIALAPRAAAVDLTVVHTNDIHGWIMPRAAYWHAADPKREIGGAAALAAFYKKVPGPKLLLDGGDWFQGTPEGAVSRGQAVVDVFNALPYDAVVVGNHDFDLSEARLKELVAGFKVPVLGANIYRTKDKKRAPYLTPWIVKELGGVKVGIMGLLTTNMANLTFAENYEGLQFRREIDEAREAVAALKKMGATVIIALTHVGLESPERSGFEGDKALAREVRGIDLIVGGHSHTLLAHPYREATYNTLIVQAGSHLTVAGKVTLTVDDKTGRVAASTGTLVELWTDEWGQDAALKKIVDGHAEAVSAVYDVVIATAQQTLTRNRNGESSMGSWMADCMRDWSGAQLAVVNGGGVRADMPQGPVTLRRIFNIMPFDNYVVKLEMDGELVREVLDHGVAAKSMLQVSGASFTYDRAAARGKRLSRAMIGGEPLDGAASYRVATVDFLVQSGDGYNSFSRAQKTDFTRMLAREVFNECARKSGLIMPPQAGRMKPAREN